MFHWIALQPQRGPWWKTTLLANGRTSYFGCIMCWKYSWINKVLLMCNMKPAVKNVVNSEKAPAQVKLLLSLQDDKLLQHGILSLNNNQLLSHSVHIILVYKSIVSKKLSSWYVESSKKNDWSVPVIRSLHFHTKQISENVMLDSVFLSSFLNCMIGLDLFSYTEGTVSNGREKVFTSDFQIIKC